jgi:hypothetical protein
VLCVALPGQSTKYAQVVLGISATSYSKNVHSSLFRLMTQALQSPTFATSIRPLNRCVRLPTASTLLLTALALRCSCLPLPWPSEHSPAPFAPPFWVHVERVCTHIAQPSSTCTSALIQASASQHPVSMLAASAAWRHALGDVYGSAHALHNALVLLHKSIVTSSQSVENAELFQEFLRTLHNVLDITPPHRASPPHPSPLSTVYPAQITPFSDFAAALLSVCRTLPQLRVLIEVGSGAGAGSTSAIIGGILRRQQHGTPAPLAFLIEIGVERRARLARRYAHLPFVRIIAASAVPMHEFPTAADVAAAHAAWTDAEFPLSDALKWRQEDFDYMRAPGAAHDGIGTALAAVKHANEGAAASSERLEGEDVDVAVLDGSEFTGWPELRKIFGARVIALDDTRTLKHRRSRAFLKSSGCYSATADVLNDRNGWAIFERIPGRECAPVSEALPV